MASSGCTAKTVDGRACRATPRRDSGLCLWHDPDLVEAAKEARRVGGQRNRREVTVRAAFNVGELDSIPDIRRIVEIVVTDLLGMESTVQRNRTLLVAAQVAASLLEVTELAERLSSIEAVMAPRLKNAQGGRA